MSIFQLLQQYCRAGWKYLFLSSEKFIHFCGVFLDLQSTERSKPAQILMWKFTTMHIVFATFLSHKSMPFSYKNWQNYLINLKLRIGYQGRVSWQVIISKFTISKNFEVSYLFNFQPLGSLQDKILLPFSHISWVDATDESMLAYNLFFVGSKRMKISYFQWPATLT